MSLAAFKIYIAGEILTASDLNASFGVIHANGEDLVSPATKAHDMNGFALIMDADADSNLRASVDDRLDLTLGGVTLFRFDGTTALSVNGLDLISSATLNAVQIKAVGMDTNISINLVPKGSGAVQVNGSALGETADVVLAVQVFH